MKHVALIGLGIMGRGLAGNILKAGHKLTVYNRTRDKAEPFAARGAQVAASPREAAAGAEIVISCVGDDAASRAVWLGGDGALAGSAPGAVLVECSTLSLDWTRELGETVKARGLDFLDAPMAGSKNAAANAELTLFVGGETAALDKARPVLEAISRRIAHLGPIGAGATYKLINNMMAAAQVAGLAEGMRLAEAAGLDMGQIRELALSGATTSPMVAAKAPRILERRYGDIDFALRWLLKDVRYALALGKQYGVSLRTMEATEAVFQAADQRGHGDDDSAAVAEGVDVDGQ
ncbi:MAG: NAD(P)-dependent oxidoreductase [Anaerolineae bacterium]|nr:NAD(P)-dependent oxidoreductase [Anaerolineae bacterium]